MIQKRRHGVDWGGHVHPTFARYHSWDWCRSGEEDLGLAALMGDREVPLVGGDQAAARGPLADPKTPPRCRNGSPPGNKFRTTLGPHLFCRR